MGNKEHFQLESGKVDSGYGLTRISVWVVETTLLIPPFNKNLILMKISKLKNSFPLTFENLFYAKAALPCKVVQASHHQGSLRQGKLRGI